MMEQNLTSMRVPDDSTLLLETVRLTLESVAICHAAEMVQLLADEALHRFVPSDPPTLHALEDTYRYWEKRISPKGDELWLNWIAREKRSKLAIGHFQAGIKASGEASIAYTVGIKFQRRGFALEALKEICQFLENKIKAAPIKAWIDTRNIASISLVKKLGMNQIATIENADQFKGASSDEFVFQLDPLTFKNRTLL